MILKYTYAYSEPKGTFYVGLKEGVTTHSITATAMSAIAAQEGGILSWLRRTVISTGGLSDTPFELVDVTPQRIKDRGMQSAEDIKEMYDLAKYDESINAAAALVAKAIKEDFAEQIKASIEPVTVASMKKYISKFFKPDFNVQVEVNKEDPSKIDVSFTVPIISIEFKLEGVKDGSQNRT